MLVVPLLMVGDDQEAVSHPPSDHWPDVFDEAGDTTLDCLQ